ncbi:MAG: transglycosylase domain-containing protein [Spirochaetes bacterium]|nr:transglycosylase domain-containing protein [Spirochaetota bacterium]
MNKSYKTLFFIKLLLLSLFLSLVILLSIFLYFYKTWQKDKFDIYYQIKSLNGAIRTYDKKYFRVLEINIYDRNNRLISNLKKNQYNYVQLNYYPSFLIDIILIKEDKEFFLHKGYDLKRIIVSFFKNILEGKILYGGSTITQQISKLLFTDRRKTIKRKIYELFTSYYIENVLSKEDILEIYLNIVYLGFGRYGFESGSLFYFNKHVWELNFSESLLLVSIISSPEYFSPIRNLDLSKKKYKTLLRKCVENNLIDKDKEERIFEEFWAQFNINKVFRDINIIDYDYAPWVTDLVIKEIDKMFTLEEAYLNNFNIYTTFDLNCILSLNKSFSKFFNDKRLFFEKMDSNDFNNIEIAVISINPETFEIVSICGGKRYSEINQYNRAIFSLRQPGSSFKPLFFLYCFLKKILTTITILEDKEYSFKLDSNIIWEPKNYGDKYYGNVPIYFAIKKSINSIPAKIATEIDLNDFLNFIKIIFGHVRNDFEKRFKPYPSIVLGSIEMSLLELVVSYATIASGGFKIKPYFIKKIESFGEVIYEVKKVEKEKIIDKRYADMILYLLKFPLEKGGTAYNARNLANFFYQTFGKTGTTNDGRDSWFIGVTGNLVTGVWVGYEKGGGNTYLTGGEYAARLYFEYIKNVYQFFLKYYDFLDSDLVFKYIDLNKINFFLDESDKVLIPFDRDNYPYNILEKIVTDDNVNLESLLKSEFNQDINSSSKDVDQIRKNKN